mgnify:CR=1 FL=1
MQYGIKILQYFSGYNCIYNVGNSEKYLNIYQIIFLIVLTITFLCAILKLTYEHISICEQPQLRKPDTDSPDTENPYLDTPDTDEPYTEKPAQLNKDRRNKEKEIPDLEVLFDLADLFKVFGDSTRIRIMFAISDNEMSVLSIAEALNMEQSTISHQLRVLRQNKLVRVRREGKQIYYTLDDDHVKKIIEMGLDHVLE